MNMAISLTIPPPPFILYNNTFASRNIPFSKLSGGKRNKFIAAKAIGDTSSSSSGSIVKSVKNAFSSSEDRIALVGLGFAGIVAIWASTNLIMAIDKLPLLPNVFEFIGILFSWWFVYRYLLFKPDREELVKIINNSISKITGQ